MWPLEGRVTLGIESLEQMLNEPHGITPRYMECSHNPSFVPELSASISKCQSVTVLPLNIGGL